MQHLKHANSQIQNQNSDPISPSTQTIKTMALGAFTGALICIPFYSWLFNKSWNWAQGFPLGWLGRGLSYISTFFHELGHTGSAWFYGYTTLPMFDFKYGGGLALMLGDQHVLIILGVYIILGAIIFQMRDYPFIQFFLGFLILFNLITAFNENARLNVIDFMGPAAVPLVASFMLIRALYDLAPRGWLERALNAIIGFGMIFMALIDSYSLIHNDEYRTLYYNQKGTHGFGDFDKISDRISFMGFHDVVNVYMALTILCLIIPFVAFWRSCTKI